MPSAGRKRRSALSLAARIELAFQVVDEAADTEQASERVYQLIGAGVSTIESVPAALAMVQLAQTDPTRCAVLCANLGGDTDTIGAMATAICGALHGAEAIEPGLLAELKRVNPLDIEAYVQAFARFAAADRARRKRPRDATDQLSLVNSYMSLRQKLSLYSIGFYGGRTASGARSAAASAPRAAAPDGYRRRPSPR